MKCGETFLGVVQQAKIWVDANLVSINTNRGTRAMLPEKYHVVIVSVFNDGIFGIYDEGDPLRVEKRMG